MTPRERWLAVLRREKPDRLPMDYWGTDETTALLIRHLGCRTRRQALEKLHVDFVVKAEPRYIGRRLPRLTDVFGCKHRIARYGAGEYAECIGHPLAGFRSADEIARHYTWPDPDWWDYSQIARQVMPHEAYPIKGGGYEPFLTYKKLRGEEQAFIDLIENPDIVGYCM